ncbi:MAG: alpha/beta hydrolase [Acetobacterales bacterium]
MGKTPQTTQLGFMQVIPVSDVTDDLPKITCPTMVITTEGSGLGSVEVTREWQRKIPNSRLLVLPGDSYHVAASHPERCAAETLAFIRRQ